MNKYKELGRKMSKLNGSQYENVNCILCSSPAHSLLIKKRGYNVNRCQQCGLVYINPRPTKENLVHFYNAKGENGAKKNHVNNQLKHDKHKRKKFEVSIELIKHFRSDVYKILDLGCSTGIFLGLAAAQGWVPHGSDVDRDVVKQNQAIYGNKVKLQHGDSIEYPDCYFEVVTLFDVIEHLHEPVAVLKEATRVLKPDGLLVVSTPAVDGLLPRLTYRLFGKTIGAWEHPTPPGHLFQFSRETLKRVIHKAGLKQIHCKNFNAYRLYTIGELENSIIDALKRGTVKRGGSLQDKTGNITLTPEEMNKGGSRNPLKKLPRLFIRGLSFSLCTTLYPVANVLSSGDSIIVVAKKSV